MTAAAPARVLAPLPQAPLVRLRAVVPREAAVPAVRPTLTDARRAAGLTMTGLARRLHVSRPTVSMWEAGTRPVARHYWPAIATALQLRPEQVSALFAGAPPARLDGVPLPSLGWARRAAGLTQRALAERVGMAPTTVSMWEVAGVRVPPWAAAELARVLGVAPARLAAGPPVPGPDPRPLRALRRSAGMTRKEAAAHLGVAVGTLDRYEAGLRTVPVTVARRMAHAYRCRLRDLPVRCGDAPLRLPRRGRWAPEDVPDGIRTLRVAAGLSRAALGRAVGRSGQAVAGWEAGRARPDEVTSRRLEEVLGLPARVLPARGQDAAAIERR